MLSDPISASTSPLRTITAPVMATVATICRTSSQRLANEGMTRNATPSVTALPKT